MLIRYHYEPAIQLALLDMARVEVDGHRLMEIAPLGLVGGCGDLPFAVAHKYCHLALAVARKHRCLALDDSGCANALATCPVRYSRVPYPLRYSWMGGCGYCGYRTACDRPARESLRREP